MLWDGNRQAQEYTDTHVFTTIYEQDSFEPVARLVWLKDELLKAANDEIKNAERESWEDEPKLIPNMQVYHYHNDHLGTPNELTNTQGEVVWLADYQAWGNTAKVVWREEKLEQLKVSADELQPIRFQGQSFDTETGLHYNRFRYFDPDLGMFISRDPIGLDGGSNVFQYAPNPTGWVDPFGLAKKKKKDCCDEEDKECGSEQNPWKKVYEENPKHGKKGRMKNGEWHSPRPTNGASYLQAALSYRSKSLVGYDPTNDEVIQFNRHQIDDTNCIHYYHGFVVNGQPVKMDQSILNIANKIGFKGKK